MLYGVILCYMVLSGVVVCYRVILCYMVLSGVVICGGTCATDKRLAKWFLSSVNG